MIILRLTDLATATPNNILSVDWQVSTDVTFAPTTIVAESIGDTVNIDSIVFNTPLDPAINYYARARMLLTTGYTGWGNIDQFKPTNIGDANVNVQLPSIVTLPTITVTNDGVDVPVMGTVLTITNLSTLGDSVHESTSYIIEDMSGVPVWNLLNSVDNKTSLNIPVYLLNPNTAYRIRILVNTSSNDTSQLLTKTIKTANRTTGLIVSNLNNISTTVDTIVNLHAPGVILTSSTGNLYYVVNNEYKLIGTYQGTGVGFNNIIIPKSNLTVGGEYVLIVTTNNPLIWDKITFTI